MRRHGVGIDLKAVDALRVVLDETAWPPDVDLIIDAAANPAVTAAVEQRRRGQAGTTPPILSLLIGHTASRGLVTVAPTGYSGAGVDILRKVKLGTRADPTLRPFAEDFFPDPPRVAHFEPEPGCSEPTFIGSDAEVAALAATLLVRGLQALRNAQVGSGTSGARAVLVDLGLAGTPAATRELSWPADVIVGDLSEGEPGGAREVRLAPAALAEMRAECRLMARHATALTETGGILLGEIDDACGVAWVTTATGPPPDSRAFENLFVCGVEGVEDRVKQSNAATGGAARFLGLWHSHPRAHASPSTIDEVGMREVLLPVQQAPRRALLLIVGGPTGRWSTWLEGKRDAGDDLPELYARLCARPSGLRNGMAARPDLDDRYVRALGAAGVGETRRWPPPARHRNAAPACRRWRPFGKSLLGIFLRRLRHGT